VGGGRSSAAQRRRVREAWWHLSTCCNGRCRLEGGSSSSSSSSTDGRRQQGASAGLHPPLPAFLCPGVLAPRRSCTPAAVSRPGSAAASAAVGGNDRVAAASATTAATSAPVVLPAVDAGADDELRWALSTAVWLAAAAKTAGVTATSPGAPLRSLPPSRASSPSPPPSPPQHELAPLHLASGDGSTRRVAGWRQLQMDDWGAATATLGHWSRWCVARVERRCRWAEAAACHRRSLAWRAWSQWRSRPKLEPAATTVARLHKRSPHHQLPAARSVAAEISSVEANARQLQRALGTDKVYASS
jgi:hypothetical protein